MQAAIEAELRKPDVQQLAQQIAAAVKAASEVGASQATRYQAVESLNSVSTLGDPWQSAMACVSLLATQQPEALHFALGCLARIVRGRWDKLWPQQKQGLGHIACEFLANVSLSTPGGRPIRVKAAGLVAETLRACGAAASSAGAHQGTPTSSAGTPAPAQNAADGEVWHAVLNRVLALGEGPVAAQVVAMTLQWLPEEITEYNTDLSAENRRAVLHMVTASLDRILPYIFQGLQRQFSLALETYNAGNTDMSREHANAVSALLQAGEAYASWTPMGMLNESGIVEAAGQLIVQWEQFRMPALNLLTRVVGRRPGSGGGGGGSDADHKEADKSTFNAVMLRAAQALAVCGARFLQQEVSEDVEEYEYGVRLSTALVELGCSYLTYLPADSQRELVGQILAFFQHKHVLYCSATVTFWIQLVRETIGKVEIVDAHILESVLDTVVVRMRRDEEGCEHLFDTIQDYQLFFSKFRGQLAELARQTAIRDADLGIRMIQKACTQVLVFHKGAMDLASLDAIVCMVEALMSGLKPQHFQEHESVTTNLQQSIHSMLETEWSSEQAYPKGLREHARLLEGFAPILSVSPALLLQGLERLLKELARSKPVTEGFLHGTMTPEENISNTVVQQARLSICRSVVELVSYEGAGLSIQSQLPTLVQVVRQLDSTGNLGGTEKVLLQDSLLCIACCGTADQAPSALEWVIADVRKDWTDSAYQRTLSQPEAFLQCYMPATDSVKALVEANDRRSRLHNDVVLLDSALKRTIRLTAAQQKAIWQPHVRPWIMIPLLDLARTLHSLWELLGQRTAPHLRDILAIGPQEVQVLLGHVPAPMERGKTEATLQDYVSHLRSWQRSLRENCYQVVHGILKQYPELLGSSDVVNAMGSSLLGHLVYLPNQIIRMLMRGCLGHVIRQCPPEYRVTGLVPMLKVLVEQVFERLNTQWASHVAPPELADDNEELQSKLAQEIVGDRILRDCSREYLLLLDCVCGTIITKKDFPQFSDTGVAAAYASKGVSKQGLQMGTLMETLVLEAGQEGLELSQRICYVSAASLAWPDAETRRRALHVCTVYSTAAPHYPFLHQVVGGTVFMATLNVLCSSDDKESESQMLLLIKNIILHLSPACPLPAQVLGAEKHKSLRAALGTVGSEKRQKQILRTALVTSSSEGTSGAGFVGKPISNLSMPTSKPRQAYDDSVLAGFNLFDSPSNPS